LLRSPSDLGLLVLGAITGVPVAVVAYFFLQAVAEAQNYVFTTLPEDLGFGDQPGWWPILPLALSGLLVALTIRYLPGEAGHKPAEGFKAGGAVPPIELPGIVLAAFFTLSLAAIAALLGSPLAMQLVLLALGLVAGSELVGVPGGDLGDTLDGPVGSIVPWVGIGVFGAGVVWFNGARASARIWIVVVLYVAYSGQVIGGLFFGSALSSFFGAVAMTPVAIIAARQRSGPTPLVMFLPAFWILVPGALGLDGVASIIGAGSGMDALVTTVTSMVGISLGILLGLLLAAKDPERPWARIQD